MVRLSSEGVDRSVAVASDPEEGHEAVRTGDVAYIDVGGLSPAFTLAPPPDVDRAARAAATRVAAPTAGRLAELSVARGDQVARGQLLAVVEPVPAATR